IAHSSVLLSEMLAGFSFQAPAGRIAAYANNPLTPVTAHLLSLSEYVIKRHLRHRILDRYALRNFLARPSRLIRRIIRLGRLPPLRLREAQRELVLILERLGLRRQVEVRHEQPRNVFAALLALKRVVTALHRPYGVLPVATG